ncbi:Bax inhibitor-1/YccA family protein [Flavobacterium salilacus subsp. salilacus]|uniref:Bax inhibitor-1/YccA family protein n=1 Tax=Flavobacterium TaxID=237 RepID=UPI001074D2DD|nr:MULTISPECIES: Bax inhibitor-1/YccA family protein [Flavobacterium]KAF2518315.1 Bax inhibitor-1/YccA family protein [Flavobacterium salilacus subsp. salilacus]MBE1615271.1 Bax inhibitor-1/YccA family protein [Flavobacterium sp. SaA2.13]NDI99617.1 Bax inhibitor-1/YccA family protein [Flavobacterium salilacus subsp. altitudinum]
MELKSNNPLLNNKAYKAGATTVYDTDGRPVEIIDYNNTMSVQGAINKSLLTLILLVSAAFVVWNLAYMGVNIFPFIIGGAITAFIVAIIAMRKPDYAHYLVPAYAVLEGVFVGGISVFFEAMYPGIVLEAVGGTFVTALVCFLLYRFKVVKVTEQFKSVVIASTLAIGTYYLISIVLSMFGVQMFHHDNSLMSIGFSVFVIVIAALNLFMDFDLIEQGAKRRLPKNMEWVSAMALMLTLVWLYLEFLRLLSKLKD